VQGPLKGVTLADVFYPQLGVYVPVINYDEEDVRSLWAAMGFEVLCM
jgi:hypothetical protein